MLRDLCKKPVDAKRITRQIRDEECFEAELDKANEVSEVEYLLRFLRSIGADAEAVSRDS